MSSSVSSEERWEMSLRLGGQTEGKLKVRGIWSNIITTDTGATVLLQKLLLRRTNYCIYYNNNPFHDHFSFWPENMPCKEIWFKKRPNNKSKSAPQQYLKKQEWNTEHPFSSQIEVSPAFGMKSEFTNSAFTAFQQNVSTCPCATVFLHLDKDLIKGSEQDWDQAFSIYFWHVTYFKTFS